MVTVTHESYDSVLVVTGKQKGLESLSENGRPTDISFYVARTITVLDWWRSYYF